MPFSHSRYGRSISELVIFENCTIVAWSGLATRNLELMVSFAYALIIAREFALEHKILRFNFSFSLTRKMVVQPWP